MRVSLNWIKRLLDRQNLGISTENLVDILSRRVAEIDAVQRTAEHLDGVVVGRVEDCQQHPNADRLRCCQVDIGSDGSVPIVCGAPNVASGQLVAVATIGTTLTMPDGKGGSAAITIKKGKLRGEASHGMICAADELGLGDDHSGIMVLDGTHAPGTPLVEALGLGDDVLEIDNHNINHRPDLWGHIGWAREIAAVLDLPFTDPCDPHWQDSGAGMQVAIRSDGCSTYCGALIEGVDNRPSPQWMVHALEAVGSRSRGLLVDITNYVMLEVGEPMHAFDRRHLAGEMLLVRDAQDKEAFTTLDEREHSLTPSDMLIADQDKGLALAGIMGGIGSMVHDDTTSIVLEAAIFAPERIRRTRQACALATDSSSRFEKGLPPEAATAAINRALHILTELIPEAQVLCRFHDGRLASETLSIPLQPSSVRRLGGVELDSQRIPQLLTRLGILADPNHDHHYRSPWWRRKDIGIEADLVEEVLRLHGYEHLVEEAPRMPLQVPHILPERRDGARMRQALSAAGWDEVQTYVFTSARWQEALAWPNEEVVELVNPPAADQTVMRRCLLPTLLEAAARNRRFLDRVAIYELGRVYGRCIGQAPLNDEMPVVAGLYCAANDDTPLYAARDAAITALAALGYQATIVHGELHPRMIAGRGGILQVDNQAVGWVAELGRELRSLVDSDDRVAYFEIPLGSLRQRLRQQPPLQYRAPSRYQQVEREFTWVCPENLEYADVAKAMQQGAKKLFRDLRLVTVYRGDPIDEGHKALSMSITLGADDRTLSDKELSKVHTAIVTTVERATAARLRG
ncbi:MAG: phenylalanine--tRNA ligase subunit beta [Planctomycetota bacterium]|nr:MAG: phenylalanine--tRNA ligase subunit beta [Planctomycetota bacterium]